MAFRGGPQRSKAAPTTPKRTTRLTTYTTNDGKLEQFLIGPMG